MEIMSCVSVVIPARLESTRLPNKVLLEIGGKPMLERVWEQVSQMKSADEVFIATDSGLVAEAAESWGAKVALTSPDCPSGTDRIASILDKLSGDFILNVQGDEPFVPPALLEDLVEAFNQNPCDIVTPVFSIAEGEEILDPNLVKAVRTGSGRALYFSRGAVPHVRGSDHNHWPVEAIHWGHIGVYGYSRDVLAKYPGLSQSPLERVEKLEQLRFLENGFSIQTVVTEYRPIGVDTEEDLIRAREMIASI
ncbi:3-deoxy-manno-octulosonate cytidylyltransferase [Rubellicoccus peritrichatus]|uniref:3-deoxy-manno-octulosonate cytidylyltransferase n=1 Tax=Rubellicoccus peritrichatus TaxID=3080537 RepID=A0AAQ3LAK7_9BACT|nr:3-deoxy-manno-octulosonate cytidylyltransferase [Puniceicoccus sp. CR14]WOO42156.1 3-deoxy-manno-octulosonate cytidylyltransferase [Puniceicoccus sp. CR14]